MKAKYRRSFTLLGLLCIGGGFILFLGMALKKNIRFYVTPSQVYEENLKNNRPLRLGGLVKKGTVKRTGLVVFFTLTDGIKDIFVTYTGLLPDLFREEQTVTVEGYFSETEPHLFIGEIILAKHDENYKPPLPPSAPSSLRTEGQD